MTQVQGFKGSCVPDSERTIILQRDLGDDGDGGGGSGECDANNGEVLGWINSHATGRRSAYFADSASEASGATGVGQSSFLPQRSFERRTFAACVAAGETPALSRTGGRRVLEGIRNDHQSSSSSQRRRNNTARDSRIEEVPANTREKLSEATGNSRNDSVFCGSIRFPASRIALWNRRPMGSPVVMTPESSAPLLVLRQRAVEHIVSKIDSLAQGSKRGSIELQWLGIGGSVGEILQGRAADDPRAASAPSQTALEIGEPDVESHFPETDGCSSGGAGRAGAGRQGSGRSSGEGATARPVVTVRGVLTAEKADYEEGEEGAVIRLGAGEVAQVESYRKLMDTYMKESATVKSASLEVFLPLRLYCTLRDTGDPRETQGQVDGEGEAEGWDWEHRGRIRQVPVFLRAEMVVAAHGVKLTPIAPLALLHTAFYQSLLTRGAEFKLQSGLLTLNEGRRAVLLSDTDPFSARAPIVGVWVSGTCGGGLSPGEHGPRPSPLRHPHAYAACLRFLLHPGTMRGKSAAAGSAMPSSAAFLVLHITGGISGGTPSFFEASAIASNGGRVGAGSGRVAGSWTDPALSFEHLDFSANMEVSIGRRIPSEGAEGRGMGVGGPEARQAGRQSSSRALVIGRLRRVSNPAFSGPFRRAQESRRSVGVARASQSLPEPLPPPVASTPARSIATVEASSSTRWHVRHHASSDGGSNAACLDEAISTPVLQASMRRVAHTPRTLQAKLVANTSLSSPLSLRSSAGDTTDLDDPMATGDNIPSSRQSLLVPRSHTPVPPSTPWTSGYSRMATEQRHSSPGERIDDGSPSSTLDTIRGDNWDHIVGPRIAESAVTPPMNINERDVGGSTHYTPGPAPIRQQLGQETIVAEDGVVDAERYYDGNIAASGLQDVQQDCRNDFVGDIRLSTSSVPRGGDARRAVSALEQSGCRLSIETASGPSVFGHPPESQEEAKSSPSSPRVSTARQIPLPSQGLDLRTLDPAARELLLAQQRQLSELEAQLRWLQAEVREADARMSMDRPLPYAPVVVRRTAVAEVLPTKNTEVENVPAAKLAGILSPAPASIPAPAPPPIPAPALAPAVMVDSTTNTSFLWDGVENGQQEVPAAARKAETKPDRNGTISTSQIDTLEAKLPSSPLTPSSQSETTASSLQKGSRRSKGQRAVDNQDPLRESCVGRTIQKGTSDVQTVSRSDGSGAKKVRESVVSDSDGSLSEVGSFEVLRVPGTASSGREYSGTSRVISHGKDAEGQRRRRHRRHSRTAPKAPGRRKAKTEVSIDSSEEKASDSAFDNAQEDKCPSNAPVSRGQGAVVTPRSADSPLRMGGRGARDALGHEHAPCGIAGVGVGDVQGPVFQEPLGLVGRRWPTKKLLPIPVTNLVMVPRIEYGELTDDELGSDLDEGETIDRIESKYLKGRALDRRSSRRR